MDTQVITTIKVGPEVRRVDEDPKKDGRLLGFCPSAAIWDPEDDEHSPSHEGFAIAALAKLCRAEESSGTPAYLWYAKDGSPFFLEMRAQASRPKGEMQVQGCRPIRVDRLRESGLPVLIAFAWSRDPKDYQWRWLHDLPNATSISDDPERKRYGWDVREWPKGLTLPETIPEPEPRAQGELL